MTPTSNLMRLPRDTPKGLRNCGVVAVAVAAGVTHKAAWDYIAKTSKRSKRWTGRTYTVDREGALRHFGVLYSEWRLPRMSLKNFCEKFAVLGQRYMVRTGGHVQIVCNGQLIDQHGLVSAVRGAISRKIVCNVLILKLRRR